MHTIAKSHVIYLTVVPASMWEGGSNARSPDRAQQGDPAGRAQQINPVTSLAAYRSAPLSAGSDRQRRSDMTVGAVHHIRLGCNAASPQTAVDRRRLPRPCRAVERSRFLTTGQETFRRSMIEPRRLSKTPCRERPGVDTGEMWLNARAQVEAPLRRRARMPAPGVAT